MPPPDAEEGPGPAYVAAGLLEVLCDLAADREPDPLTVPLGVTHAEDLGVDLPAGTAVFTHLYLPDTGRSVRAVFGVDLGTPAGRTPGLFVAHPDGRRQVTKEDDLREVVLVAVPPWEPDAVVAFDRRGRRRPLERLDVDPPEETLP